VFDSHSKVEPVHGVETDGLGTSTFMEGTPAAASAIRRESETGEQPSGGLGRTRSIAQRFKGVRNRDRSNSSGVAVTTPEASYVRTVSPSGRGNLSGGGLKKINEQNPFFNDYDSAYDAQGEKIRAAKGNSSVTVEDKGSAPSKPMPTQLTRTVTEGSAGPQHYRSDSNGSQEGRQQQQGGGFLGRMKSLRGKKKERSQE